MSLACELASSPQTRPQPPHLPPFCCSSVFAKLAFLALDLSSMPAIPLIPASLLPSRPSASRPSPPHDSGPRSTPSVPDDGASTAAIPNQPEFVSNGRGERPDSKSNSEQRRPSVIKRVSSFASTIVSTGESKETVDPSYGEKAFRLRVKDQDPVQEDPDGASYRPAILLNDG